MMAANPENPLNLVAGGLYQKDAAFNNSMEFYRTGSGGAFTSFDGGKSWLDSTLSPNPAWANASSVLCGDVLAGNAAVAFGRNSTVYYVDLAYPEGKSHPGLCGRNASTAQGVYLTVSHDGGITWGIPIPIQGYIATYVDKPWVAVDPSSGKIYVAYNDNGGGRIYLQNSSDGGKSWSPPVAITGCCDSMFGVELVVDPIGAIDAVWLDETSSAIDFARSTDGGMLFSPTVIVARPIAVRANPYPDSFRAYTIPALGLDAFSTNSYTGRLFIVWQNGSGGSAGSPTISLSYSSDNGFDWSKPQKVNSDATLEGFQPSLAIGHDGTVYVQWYGENATTGTYRLLGSESHNGGARFDPEVELSDVSSFPIYPGGFPAGWIGDYTYILASPEGGRALWTDSRATQRWNCSSCLWGYVYNTSLYTASLVNFTLSSNVPITVGVTGTVTPSGSWSLGPEANYGDWLVGQTYSILAPTTVVVNGSTWYFESWNSSSGERTPVLSGTVNGTAAWKAYYAETDPGEVLGTVTPAGANLLVDSASVTVAPNGSFDILLPPGTHFVAASGAYYSSLNRTVDVSSDGVVNLPIALVPEFGTINGTLTPSFANLTLNGAPVPVAGGSHSLTLLSGTYWINASSSGYVSYRSPPVRLVALDHLWVNITLELDRGWIEGSIAPAGARLAVDGNAGMVVTGGAFNATVSSGSHRITVTAPGYRPFMRDIQVPLGGTFHLKIDLTLNQSPASAPGIYWIAAVGAALAVDTALLTVFVRWRSKRVS